MANRRITLLAAAFSVAFPALACADIQDHLLSGTKFAEQKKYKEAAREFKNALNLDPEHPEANLLMGLTLTNAGELERAIPYAEKSVSLKPSYAGYYNLGLIHSNRGKFERAAEAYGRAVEINPKSYQAWHLLGKVHAASLQFEKAVEAYGQAIRLNPKFPEAYQGLASAHYWTGSLSGALQQLDALNKLGFSRQAKELERWIQDKEKRKEKAAKKASPEAAQAK